MDRITLVAPRDVAPGDVGFDHGRSLYGRVASRLTGSREAHCWVYHRPAGPARPDGRRPWLVAELSGAHGAIYTERVVPATRVVRVWRDATEQARLLEASRRVVAAGVGYDWVEIGRILLTLSGRRPPRRRQREKQICADHVVACICAARPDLAPLFADPHEPRWPRLVLARLLGDDVDPALVTAQLPVVRRNDEDPAAAAARSSWVVGAAGVEPATSRV